VRLKTRIHQELLGILDLKPPPADRREDAEPEIRSVLSGLLAREQAMPLNLFERECLIVDVINELFGLGRSRRCSGIQRSPTFW